METSTNFLSAIDLTSVTGWATVALLGLAVFAVVWVLRALARRAPARRRDQGSRLGIVEAAVLTEGTLERRLVLVRRDETEHLLLIGGASDLVIESGIGVKQDDRREVAPTVVPFATPERTVSTPAPPETISEPSGTQQPAARSPLPEAVPSVAAQERRFAAPAAPDVPPLPQGKPGSPRIPSVPGSVAAPPPSPVVGTQEAALVRNPSSEPRPIPSNDKFRDLLGDFDRTGRGKGD